MPLGKSPNGLSIGKCASLCLCGLQNIIINMYDGIAQSYTIHLSNKLFSFRNVIGLVNAFILGYQFHSAHSMEALPFYFFGVCPDEVGQDSMNTGMDMFKAIDPLFPLRLC